MTELIIYRANVMTMCPKRPNAEAIAISNGKIAALGAGNEILKLKNKHTKIIDAGGALLLPGFIDSHLHLLEGSERLFHIRLTHAKSKDEFKAIFSRELKKYKKGEWILGGDWNHENWGGLLPDKSWIDHLTPDNPVWVKRLDGHMGLANSLAIKLSGLDKNSKPVEGGEIHYKDGSLSGIFKDRAMEHIENHLPEITDQEKEKYILKGQQYLAARGVTSAHYLNLFEPIDHAFFERFRNQGKLTIRLYISYPLSNFEMLEKHLETKGTGDQWIRYGILKAFMDGSLGSQTAAFCENYKGSTKNGLFVTDLEKLQRMIEDADSRGMQIAVHAIGNRANHEVLKILGSIRLKNGNRDRRFRVEHAQHVNKEDIAHFAELKAIASMQPLHLSDDGCWAHKILEHHALNGSYPFKSMLDSNAFLAFGSDWFVSEPSPLLGIHAAVNRQTFDGQYQNGWLPDQKISVFEAVKAYTINAAYASFEENIKGSLSVDKLADMVLLDQNIFEIEPEEIKNTRVLLTLVDGKIVYKS